MFPVQNGLICWLDAMDGKAGDTLLKDRTSYGHNLIVENFQQGYGFTGTSIKVKQGKIGTSNNNALYIANGGFKTSCKSFCICIERHNTNQPWYIFDGRGLNGQGLSTNHCFNGNTGSSYDNSKTRRDGVLTYDNSNLDTNKKTFLYFELKEAELFTLSILMRFSKNENTEGEFYSLYAYNRALTEEEILQNMEYENNKISYVNENNLPKIVDKLSNASNIKITGNKYGNRVQTVIDKIVEKADDVTKAIEQEVNNNGYSFKVGQGNNVDVVSDVQDSFSNLAIKGVTYQNLFNNFSMSQEATNYITVNQKTIKWTKSVVTSGNVNIKYHNALVELNGVYTLVFYVYKNTLKRDNQGDSYNVAKFNIVSYNSGTYMLPVNYTGLVKVKLQQPSTTPSDGKPYFEVYKDVVGELEISYPILLKGDYTSDTNIPSYFDDIAGVGEVSKNLFDIKAFVPGGINSDTGGLSSNAADRITSPFIEMKANTPYTISGVGSRAGSAYYDINKNYLSGIPVNTFIPTQDGYARYTINTLYDYSKAQLEQGKYATEYHPYNTCRIPLITTNKNIFDIGSNYENILLSTTGKTYPTATAYGYTLTSGANRISWFNPKIKEGTKFYVAIKITNRTESSTIGFYQTTNYKQDYTSKRIIRDNVYFFGTTSIGKDAKVGIYFDSSIPDGNSAFISDFFVGLGEIPDEFIYEPYKGEQIDIFLDEPLMKLPNGVYDEITKDGKLIRRIKKVVVDSSKEWRKSHESYDSDTNITFDFLIDNITDGWTTGDNKICNILFSKSGDKSAWNGQSEGISNDMYSKLFITLNKSKLQSQNIQGLKAWLDSNPVIIVYYELKTPIITDLSESQIRMFKDGVIKFDTLVAPESTHYVQLNKSAQIQSAIKESQLLDNKIDNLENGYDTLMLSTMSRLNNLELDYTLK